MSNRRDQARVPVQLFVEHIFEGRRQVLCVSEDLSREGMRVVGRMGDDWGAPRHVWLRFQLPGESEPIQALGELRHEAPLADGRPVRGFKFKYIYPQARRRYERFVETMATEQVAAAC